MKKYLKRWNELTEDQKLLFFTNYMMKSEMCDLCIQPVSIVPPVKQFRWVKDKHNNNIRYRCIQCRIMFPLTSLCPCNEFLCKAIPDHPPTVIEYCLIHDGWIEKE